jgi:hypothetical protein
LWVSTTREWKWSLFQDCAFADATNKREKKKAELHFMVCGVKLNVMKIRERHLYYLY